MHEDFYLLILSWETDICKRKVGYCLTEFSQFPWKCLLFFFFLLTALLKILFYILKIFSNFCDL